MGKKKNSDTKPSPEGICEGAMKIYESKDMYIGLLKMDFDFEQACTHAHDGYEFLVPLVQMPNIHIDGKTLSAGKGTIVPTNPWQDHGASGRMMNLKFIDIMVDRIYMENTAFSVFGNKRPWFKNEAILISPEIQYVINAFTEESKYQYPGKELLLQSYCCQFTVKILREACEGIELNELKTDHGHQRKINKVMEYLNENYNHDCSLDLLAEIACMNRYHFIRVFRQIAKKPPYDYLVDIRISNAKSLLRNKALSITEVATRCGFNNMCYFSSNFKKRTGYSPSVYRNRVSL